MKPLIDWPYPDRPKLQQIQMTWRDMRREGLGRNFGRMRGREKVVVLMAFLVGFGGSMAVAVLLGRVF